MEKTMVAIARHDNSILFKGKNEKEIEKQIYNFIWNGRKTWCDVFGYKILDKVEYPYNVMTKSGAISGGTCYTIKFKIDEGKNKIMPRESKLTVEYAIIEKI